MILDVIHRRIYLVDYKNAVEIAKDVYWVGELMENDAFQCHAYLIVDGKESILIDSGSMLEFENIKAKVTSVIPLKNIKYIVAHHQDPDVCANIPAFERDIDRDDLEIISHSRNIALIKHYGIKSKYYIIEDHEFKLKIKNNTLSFLTTPYAHAPGAFVTYLENKKILFSSDIFGAVEENWHFFANKDYSKEIKLFHENYMPSQDILNYALDKIQPLDLELIAPQHGSLIKNKYINLVIDELRKLKCGLYIQDSYQNSLVYKNQLLKEKEQQEIYNNCKIETIMDMQEDIIIITNGSNLKYINDAFFKFTNYKNIDDFKQNHNCICELFLEHKHKNYLQSHYENNAKWIDKLIENKHKEYYALLNNKNNNKTLFKITLKEFYFNNSTEDEYLINFHDVTYYMESLDFIEILSHIKGVYFCISDSKNTILKVSDSLINILDIKNHEQKTYLLTDFFNAKDTKLLQEHIDNQNSSSYEIKLRYNNIKIPIFAKEFFGTINQKPVIISIFTDLTELKTLQKESKKKDLILIQQSKMVQMGEMINMIAHQWRQPLNAITAASTKIVLTKELDMMSDEDFFESNDFIQKQCQKMSDVINTFLNYSKTSKEKQEISITKMIDNVLGLVLPQFINHNIKIIVRHNVEDIKLIGHSDMLEQVIINLLMNARDAYDEIKSFTQKELIISLEKDSIITITDYAGGISEKNQEKLFTPYFTTKEQGKGTGLGLYMSKRIINEQFNADLIYNAIENGSQFKIIFTKQ